MSDNVRIMYDNLADAATLTASSTSGGYVINNVKLDNKSAVWRTTGSTGSLTGVLPATSSVSCVIVPYCNLPVGSSIRIRLYSDTARLTQVYDSGIITNRLFLHGNTASNAYSYGGGSCLALYFNAVATCRSFTLDFVNSAGTFVEVSRVLLGSYWSPKFNTDFGLSVELNDATTEFRTESGDLINDAAPKYKLLNFSLNFMDAADRDTLFAIIRRKGRQGSVYLSIFPEDTDKEKEGIYQVYGRFAQNLAITHPMYTIYSTSIGIQEV